MPVLPLWNLELIFSVCTKNVFQKSYWIQDKNVQVPERNYKLNGWVTKRQWDSQTCQTCYSNLGQMIQVFDCSDCRSLQRGDGTHIWMDQTWSEVSQSYKKGKSIKCVKGKKKSSLGERKWRRWKSHHKENIATDWLSIGIHNMGKTAGL